MSNFINNTKQPFTVVTNDILQNETIFKNATQKLCYLYLYSLKGFKTVFPSQRKIAIACCCSVSTVKRTLSDLVDLGLLVIKNREGFTNIYILNDYHDVVQNELGDSEIDQYRVSQNELSTQFNMNSDQVHNELVKSISKTNKDKSNKLVNKESVNNNQEITDKLILEYMKKGLSKEVCFRVLEEVKQTEGIKNFGGYLRTCLENTLYKSELKKDPSKKYGELTSHLPSDHPLKYNWLEEE